jgi:hypothetical protein
MLTGELIEGNGNCARIALAVLLQIQKDLLSGGVPQDPFEHKLAHDLALISKSAGLAGLSRQDGPV